MIFQELSALFSFIYSQTSLSKFGKFVNISLDTGCYLVDFIGFREFILSLLEVFEKL